jgi:hypothetical protein
MLPHPVQYALKGIGHRVDRRRRNDAVEKTISMRPAANIRPAGTCTEPALFITPNIGAIVKTAGADL